MALYHYSEGILKDINITCSNNYLYLELLFLDSNNEFCKEQKLIFEFNINIYLSLNETFEKLDKNDYKLRELYNKFKNYDLNNIKNKKVKLEYNYDKLIDFQIINNIEVE